MVGLLTFITYLAPGLAQFLSIIVIVGLGMLGAPTPCTLGFALLKV